MDVSMISKAHEYVQAQPLTDNAVFCVRCKITVPIKEMASAARCIEHHVKATSGWKPE
jgi:hypothetical protein